MSPELEHEVAEIADRLVNACHNMECYDWTEYNNALLAARDLRVRVLREAATMSMDSLSRAFQLLGILHTIHQNIQDLRRSVVVGGLVGKIPRGFES